jgi:serine/threonine protein kinase
MGYCGDKVDIWCCGIMLLMMITKRYPPWQVGAREFVVDQAMIDLATRFNILRIDAVARVRTTVGDSCWDLLQKMLLLESQLRPTTTEALAHPWFAGMS